jgi:hypothetical protein
MAAQKAAMLKIRFRQQPGASLVLAALDKHRQHQQIRVGKQPLIRLGASRFGRARDESQVPAARKIPQVIEADSRQPRDLVFREKLLAGLYRQHFEPLNYFDAATILEAVSISLQ